MAKARKRNGEGLERRPGETHLQWRSRIARMNETVRGMGEDIVTQERIAKGDLEEVGARKQGEFRRYRKRSTSSLARLCARGVLTSDQLAAAQEIAIHCQRIRNEAGGSSGGLSEQVDCSNSSRNYGYETLHRVCMERAYSEWRSDLPLPRGMVLDMVTEDHQLAAIASRYRKSWRKAVDILKAALNVWPQYKREAFDGIDQDDIDEANRRVA